MEGGALGLDDLAVGDDLLLDVREVADNLVRAALEHLVLDDVELVRDLVEDREAVVEEVVEDLVQQAPRPAGEDVIAQALVVLTAPEETRDRRARGWGTLRRSRGR